MTVTRPSDALAARARTDKALTALLLGLGGVALLVGVVGIANVGRGGASLFAAGAIAGVYPAVRSARLAPAEAIHPA